MDAQRRARRPPRLDVGGLYSLLELCSSCARDVMADDVLRDQHGVRFVHLVDFDQIHKFLSPWFSNVDVFADSNVGASYPVASALFSTNAAPYFLSPGCMAEMTDFLNKVLHRTTALRRSILTQGPQEEKGLLVKYFMVAGAPHHREHRSSSLLREAEALGQEHVVSLASLERVSIGIQKLRSLLVGNCAAEILQYANDESFMFSIEDLRANREAIEKIPNRGDRTHNNLIDAHNITLADSLNRHFLERSKSDPSHPIYFTRILTDTPAIYKARDDLELRLSYVNYFGHKIELFEPAEHLLVKRKLHTLVARGNAEDVEELLQSAAAALASLEITRWQLAKSGAPIDAMIYDLLPAPRGGDTGSRLRRHFADLSRFAHVLRRTVADEIGTLSDRDQRRLSREERTYPNAAPELCDSIINEVLDLQRLIDATNKLGFKFTELQKHPQAVLLDPQANISFAECGLVVERRRAEGLESIRLVPADNDDETRSTLVDVSFYENSTVVAWLRTQNLAQCIAQVLGQYESSRGQIVGQCVAGLLDESIAHFAFASRPEFLDIARKSHWVRLSAGDVDLHFEITVRSGQQPRAAVILDANIARVPDYLCELVLDGADAWIPKKAFLDEFWHVAWASTGRNRGGRG